MHWCTCVGVHNGLMMNACVVEMSLMKSTALIKEYLVCIDYVWVKTCLVCTLVCCFNGLWIRHIEFKYADQTSTFYSTLSFWKFYFLLHTYNFYGLLTWDVNWDTYLWPSLRESTMWVQITPSYIFANIFCSECTIPFP